mmetsp:Transcript_28598/g.88609  ORF Transcript_28598/g.88609 Transcript_28598/m.88609 type:complete len:281 (+) Transcript_28598:240-1082(+)
MSTCRKDVQPWAKLALMVVAALRPAVSRASKLTHSVRNKSGTCSSFANPPRSTRRMPSLYARKCESIRRTRSQPCVSKCSRLLAPARKWSPTCSSDVIRSMPRSSRKATAYARKWEPMVSTPARPDRSTDVSDGHVHAKRSWMIVRVSNDCVVSECNERHRVKVLCGIVTNGSGPRITDSSALPSKKALPTLHRATHGDRSSAGQLSKAPKLSPTRVREVQPERTTRRRLVHWSRNRSPTLWSLRSPFVVTRVSCGHDARKSWPIVRTLTRPEVFTSARL